MKKATVLALALICLALPAKAFAAYSMYQAAYGGAPGAPFLLNCLLSSISAWALFLLGVRTLASAAPHDFEAEHALHTITSIFRAVPFPETLRGPIAALAGL